MKNYYISFAILLLMGCKSKHEKNIETICSDCAIEEVDESDLILVKNKEGKSNVYSKTTYGFLLQEWHTASFNPGIFYDDITFVVNGDKVMCPDHDYNLLSDKYLDDKLDKQKYNDELNTDMSRMDYCSKHEKVFLKGNNCNSCFQEKIEKELNKPGGFVDRASHL